MALRHNISDNPQMLGLAKSKVAQLRSTMAKKTKHLSQIIKTKDGLMKLRIAGENEYAYLLKNPSKWLDIIEYFTDANVSWPGNIVHKNNNYSFVITGENHIVYLFPNNEGKSLLISSLVNSNASMPGDYGNWPINDISILNKMLRDSSGYSYIVEPTIHLSNLFPGLFVLGFGVWGWPPTGGVITINTKYFNKRGPTPSWLLESIS